MTKKKKIIAPSRRLADDFAAWLRATLGKENAPVFDALTQELLENVSRALSQTAEAAKRRGQIGGKIGGNRAGPPRRYVTEAERKAARVAAQKRYLARKKG